MIALAPRIVESHWLPVKDGDARAFALFQRHYSYEQFYRYLLQIETEKGIRHADPNA